MDKAASPTSFLPATAGSSSTRRFSSMTASPATTAAAPAAPSAPAATARPSETGVALGLFSKIAAARKEKLSPFNLRWSRQEEARLRTPLEPPASPTPASPMLAANRRPPLRSPADRSRRSLADIPELIVLDSTSAAVAAASSMKSAEHVSEVPEQESQLLQIYFAEATDEPGVPMVYRNPKAKAANPERLNLDRRNLPVVPLLDGEHMLRLLNVQNNVIRRIEHLTGLPNLIFLDLYNNRIERLENLQSVPNLRVLMLGKNRLKRIENLDVLKKLDVLDLHSNEIDRMENLNDLTELRVLNLGGNRIRTLENIDRLTLLTELNLRRNSIEQINATIGRLPSLQRLFLSNNRIESLDVLEPLLQVASIIELRLDNNHVCESNQAEYRSRMIRSFPLLKHLDLRPLTDAERKEGLLYFTQARIATKEREDLEEAQRSQAIALIRSQWEKRSSRTDDGSATSTLHPRHSAWDHRTANSRLMDAQEPDVRPTSREEVVFHKNKAGFSEIEVHGDFRVLAIYGDALEALESAKAHTTVNTIKFRYVGVDKISSAATSPSSTNLKLFARLRRLNFAFNDIQSFEQITWLASLGTKAEEVFLSQNAVCRQRLLRSFIAARLHNVSRLNGDEITLAERQLGRQLFQKTARVKTLDVSGDSGSIRARERESAVTSPSRHAVTVLVKDVVSAGSELKKKRELVDTSWSTVLSVIIKDTLQDMKTSGESCLAGCLDGL
ncbi:hypothetical protein P43SY_005591 [Pythium insidiosum]|uniref:Protein phosphatase 1 regulatory subunit 7 n=1 Tax=Pythium insidiosum TaxID=114742 RepID=A0AAD5Q8Q6_PYTIN|nr:hypothetical protein P43SY_005591 [Pythium insidiosum]